MGQSNEEAVLFNFKDAQTASMFQPLHDIVMGGRSSGFISHVASSNGFLRFQGRLVLEGGGFVTIRCNLRSPLNLSQFTGVRIQCRVPDKNLFKRYKLALYDTQGMSSITHQKDFVPPNGDDDA